ncbi:MAG: CoA-binding protein [Dehalococcoidales bacterium]
MQELIKEFMQQKKFAIVGASDNPLKFGNRIVKNLKARGYAVFPVNPRLKEVEGLVCYKRLADIPVAIDVVDFVVPPAVTEEVLKECFELGIQRIWLQPGSESTVAINYCYQKGLKIVHNACVLIN